MKNPAKNNKAKFVKTHKQKLILNEELIDKTTKLLGIKGYYTDLSQEEMPTDKVIERYSELYKVEQTFRMAKSDFQTRPIFHYKEDPIKLHLLICFLALVVAKHIELQTGVSIKRFNAEIKKIADAWLFNKLTNKETIVKTKISDKAEASLSKLNLSH